VSIQEYVCFLIFSTRVFNRNIKTLLCWITLLSFLLGFRSFSQHISLHPLFFSHDFGKSSTSKTYRFKCTRGVLWSIVTIRADCWSNRHVTWIDGWYIWYWSGIRHLIWKYDFRKVDWKKKPTARGERLHLFVAQLTGLP
jgi:hypothetical protein